MRFGGQRTNGPSFLAQQILRAYDEKTSGASKDSYGGTMKNTYESYSRAAYVSTHKRAGLINNSLLVHGDMSQATGIRVPIVLSNIQSSFYSRNDGGGLHNFATAE